MTERFSSLFQKKRNTQTSISIEMQPTARINEEDGYFPASEEFEDANTQPPTTSPINAKQTLKILTQEQFTKIAEITLGKENLKIEKFDNNGWRATKNNTALTRTPTDSGAIKYSCQRDGDMKQTIQHIVDAYKKECEISNLAITNNLKITVDGASQHDINLWAEVFKAAGFTNININNQNRSTASCDLTHPHDAAGVGFK